MADAAERMKRSRARRREGRRVLRVAVDEALIEMMLVDSGHLRPELADDPNAVAEALARMIDRIADQYMRCL